MLYTANGGVTVSSALIKNQVPKSWQGVLQSALFEYMTDGLLVSLECSIDMRHVHLTFLSQTSQTRASLSTSCHEQLHRVDSQLASEKTAALCRTSSQIIAWQDGVPVYTCALCTLSYIPVSSSIYDTAHPWKNSVRNTSLRRRLPSLVVMRDLLYNPKYGDQLAFSFATPVRNHRN